MASRHQTKTVTPVDTSERAASPNGPPLSGGADSKWGWTVWIPLLLFSVLWVDLIRLLSATWNTREQYAYGWFVPFFVLGFLWRRWSSRPAAGPAEVPVGLKILVVLPALALLPLRVIYEINSDWPLISWMIVPAIVGITLYPFYLAGGWSWVRHFAFPVCFILVAVAWPYRIEKGLTHGLMEAVTALTVELLGMMSIAAVPRGNLIELPTGVVGIDEACSGIRSFQSTLMGALLMGELYRMRVRQRIGLLICGLGLAFGFNVVRTLLLTWQAARQGIGAIERWHDSAGLSILVACVLCLWALAASMSARSGTVSRSARLPEGASSVRASFPRGYLLAMGCWGVGVLALTEVWYRAHDKASEQGAFHWSINLPSSKPTYREIELTPRTRKIIGHDEGAAGGWEEDDGSEWSLYFFRWQPTSIEKVLQARVHRPDICLPAAGLKEIADLGVAEFTAGEVILPFRRYVYALNEERVHVFFCQWEDGDRSQVGLRGSGQAGRLRSVWRGRRRLGQQTLEIIVSGHSRFEDSERAVREALPALVVSETKG